MNEAETIVAAVGALRTLVRAAVADALAESRPPTERARRVLLTGPELQEALGVSAPTVRALRRDGMPHVMVGTEPRYEVERCLEWLRARGSAAEVAE